MLGALLPPDVAPQDSCVPLVTDLREVTFYVPEYMGGVETVSVMGTMPHLQVVQLLTAGYDNVLPYLPAGVTLCNARGVHDASTAELAVGLMLASLRGIDDYARAMPSGRWLSGRRTALADLRVLIVGAGGIARALRDRLLPFEVDVMLVGRTAREDVESAERLTQLLPNADVVVLAVPLDDTTRGLVGTGFLGSMREGALLVNVSRGAVVDTESLVEAAAAGRVRAALDVTDPEPLPPEHPLWLIPGVLVSPHVGGNSTAFLPRARRLVAAQLERHATGEPLAHVVRPA